MKKIFITIVLYFIIFTQVSAQWFWQNPKNSYDLYKVFFVDENNGWAVGANSAIMKTNNGGLNWTETQIRQHAPELRTVFFASTNVGWVGGAGGIHKTIDGRLNWSNQFPWSGRIWSLFFVNPDTGWFVENDGIIFKTTNGGSYWFNQFRNYYSLYSIYFIDGNTGWAVGARTIVVTTNGGSNWSLISNNPHLLYSVYFLDKNNGWAVGTFGVILNTTDGGLNWTRQISPTGNWLRSVKFINSKIGWIVGDHGTILKTTDGGANWLVQFTGTGNHLFSVCFIDSSTGWAVGQHGTILKTTNSGGVTFVEERDNQIPNTFLLFQNYPNPFNPSTKIKYTLPQRSFVTIKVFDLLGREITTIINEEKPPGEYEVDFIGSSANGGLPSGVYFYRLEAGRFIETKKLILLR